MTPLHVRARVLGALALPGGPLALDSLLAATVARVQGLPPPATVDQCERIEIPVQLEPEGRFHLASFGVAEPDQHELRHKNRRAPIEQYQALGSAKIKSVRIQGGPDKSYRIPMDVEHASGDAIDWWCLGDDARVRELLSYVTHLGHRRAVGLGRVLGWDVEACEPWDGFPVVRDGLPLRPLPLDWPGLRDPMTGFRTLTYPYWDHASEGLCAIPG